MPAANRTNMERRVLPVAYYTRDDGGEDYTEGSLAIFPIHHG